MKLDGLKLDGVVIETTGKEANAANFAYIFWGSKGFKSVQKHYTHYSSLSPAASRSVHVASAWSAGSTGMPRSRESIASAKAARMSVYLRRLGGDVHVDVRSA